MEIKDILYVVGAVVLGNFIYDKAKPKLEAFGLGAFVRDPSGQMKTRMGPYGPEYYNLSATVSDPTNQFPVKQGSFGPEYIT